MRAFILISGLIAFTAQADLYRWIDRETGSVKFSNTPPPWYGDPDKEKTAPAVEVIRYQPPGSPAKPAPRLETALAQWLQLQKFFSSLPATTDYGRAGAGIRQHMEAYQALSVELDRIDPAGAARRRAQDAGVLETIRRGLEAQLSPKPPVQ